MKSLLLASAALAAALVAAPAFAGDGSGYVDLSYGNANWNAKGGWCCDTDVRDLRLSGAYTASITAGWNVQFDARADNLDWANSSDGTDHVSYAAVHAFTRTADYAVGGFAGELNYYGDGGYMLGVEGAKYLNTATLSASLGYGHFNQSSDYSLWNAQVGGKYFVNDDLSLDAAVGYTKWDSDYGSEYKDWIAGVGAEYKFASSPASLFAQYRFDDLKSNFGWATRQNTFMVGVRWNFGSDSLKQRDRTGASMGGAAALAENQVHW